MAKKWRAIAIPVYATAWVGLEAKPTEAETVLVFRE